ncbi:hypothetical protein [Methanococcus voltae]|uniref:hypothetical protein n=1 Tax=Methanococcus voltae TaxID=2188 RepID=UPI001AE1D9C9|nr:hypothetical protein [Methanococcus voltae]MBP2172661.1 hypothetical protein [Methanococcus voltae]
MKKFLIKSVIFFTIFILLLYSLNIAYTNTNGYKSLNDVYKFKNVPQNLELVNFGNSHGMLGLNYDDENYNTFNFALSAQIYYYDYYLLQQYSKNLKKDCVVLIPFSHLCLYQNYDSEIALQEPRYYGILDHTYLNLTPEKYIRYEVCPVLSAGEHIGYILKDKANISNSWEYTNSYMPNHEVKNDVKNIINHYYTKPVENRAKVYLENIIVYCNNNGFKPVLVTIPLTNTYNNEVPPKAYEEFYGYLANVTEKYNITYIDYSNYTEISSNHTLFKDSNHLNLNGRKKFTKILISDLQNKSLL